MELDRLTQERIAKLERLRAAGIDPYPARSQRTHTAAEALALFEQAAANWPAGEEHPRLETPVTVAGRLMSLRVMGKAAFGHLADGSGRIQVYFKLDNLGETAYTQLKELIDLGDFLQVSGPLFRTRTGETTVEARSYTLLTKTLSPLPEKWHGLRDPELRYRQRYLDLLVNPDVRRTFEIRTGIVTAMRRFLDGRGFLEVETPVLQPQYGGATARPFITHHNALDQDFYLRIATELYLKRLIVGGIDKVYEIGKDFRNEGIDFAHNPEFTMMESYEAYADYNDVMCMVEEMISTIAQEVLGTMQIEYGDYPIDLTPPWPRRTMRQAILDETGIDISQETTLESLRAAVEARELRLDFKPTWAKTVDELFGEYVQPKLIQPVFIIDYPVALSPLAKKKPGDPTVVERFEAFIACMEAGNAFSELNDPLDQLERFREQAQQRAAGDEEAQPLDEDFVTALLHGMPPTGGLGVGIDRLTMILTGQTSIREVILFPSLRSKG